MISLVIIFTSLFLYRIKWKFYSLSAYIITDLKLGKEIFANAAFAGRAFTGTVNDLYTTGSMHGILNTEGEHWEQIRRFTLRQLRNFGFGKSTMESLIMDDVMEVIDWMKSAGGKPLEEIDEKMSYAFLNSLWTIVSGRKYSKDDVGGISIIRDVTK